jgi:hypothetical protein
LKEEEESLPSSSGNVLSLFFFCFSFPLSLKQRRSTTTALLEKGASSFLCRLLGRQSESEREREGSEQAREQERETRPSLSLSNAGGLGPRFPRTRWDCSPPSADY